MKKEEFREKILELIGEEYRKKKELDLIIKKYFSNETLEQSEDSILIKDYNNKIESEILKFEEKTGAKRTEIKKLVTAISFATRSRDKYNELPLIKNISKFGIEKIYFLYTIETEGILDEIIINLKEIRGNLKTEKILIKKLTVDESYLEIKKLVSNKKITNKDTILDITLGMKIISLAMYKIASENQLLTINWSTKEFLKYEKAEEKEEYVLKNGTQVVSAIYPTIQLNLLEEPINEYNTLKNMINLAIEKLNFSEVANYYKISGRNDMNLFYIMLSDIFDSDKLLQLEYDDFYENIEKNLKNLFLKEEEFQLETIEKIKPVLLFLLYLILYEEVDENFEKSGVLEHKVKEIKWFESKRDKFKIGKKDFQNLVEEYGNIDKERYFYYFMLRNEYLKNQGLNKNGKSIYEEKIIERINTELRDEKQEMTEFKNLEDVQCFVFENEEITEFEFEEKLQEERKKLLFDNKGIVIPYNGSKKINQIKLNICIRNKTLKVLLKKLSTEKNIRSISLRELKKMFDLENSVRDETLKYATPYKRLKENIDKINEEIIKKLIELGEKPEKFILYNPKDRIKWSEEDENDKEALAISEAFL